jgi:hypothetical protein
MWIRKYYRRTLIKHGKAGVKNARRIGAKKTSSHKTTVDSVAMSGVVNVFFFISQKK